MQQCRQGQCVQARRFALTAQALRSLEAAAAAVRLQEPVLLVGETGSGKTTLLQHLADQVKADIAAEQFACAAGAAVLGSVGRLHLS